MTKSKAPFDWRAVPPPILDLGRGRVKVLPFDVGQLEKLAVGVPDTSPRDVVVVSKVKFDPVKRGRAV